MKSITFIWVAVCLLSGICCQEKLLYLYKPPHVPPQNIDLSQIRNTPVYIPINCEARNCDTYKPTQFPTIIYWKGSGSAFQRIFPVTPEGAINHLKNKQIGYFNKFRRWIEDWTQLQTLIYSFVFGSFLYTVFGYLFSPPKSEQQLRKQHATKKKPKNQ